MWSKFIIFFVSSVLFFDAADHHHYIIHVTYNDLFISIYKHVFDLFFSVQLLHIQITSGMNRLFMIKTTKNDNWHWMLMKHDANDLNNKDVHKFLYPKWLTQFIHICVCKWMTRCRWLEEISFDVVKLHLMMSLIIWAKKIFKNNNLLRDKGLDQKYGGWNKL